MQAWSPILDKDMECLERVQRLAIRMLEGQKGKTYEERLRDLRLYSLTRRLKDDLIETFKIMKGITKLDPEDMFDFAPR